MKRNNDKRQLAITTGHDEDEKEQRTNPSFMIARTGKTKVDGIIENLNMIAIVNRIEKSYRKVKKKKNKKMFKIRKSRIMSESRRVKEGN